MDSLSRFDLYPKTRDELKVRTLGGAVISITCSIFAVLLFSTEFSRWRAIETADRRAPSNPRPWADALRAFRRTREPCF